jgi:hypothetical protein
VVIKISLFWDMTPCSLLKVGVSEELAACFMLVSSFPFLSTLNMDATCSSEGLLTFTGLHCVISQKTDI